MRYVISLVRLREGVDIYIVCASVCSYICSISIYIVLVWSNVVQCSTSVEQCGTVMC